MWILAALRNHTFFNLEELNKAVTEKLIEFNNRTFKKMDGSRRSLFESIDKPAMKPLPIRVYEYAEWKKATVNVDYHVTVDDHHYSVPYQLTKERVDVCLTADTIEILYKNNRVASHARSYDKWGHTTLRNICPSPTRNFWNGLPPGSSPGPVKMAPIPELWSPALSKVGVIRNKASAPVWGL